MIRKSILSLVAAGLTLSPVAALAERIRIVQPETVKVITPHLPGDVIVTLPIAHIHTRKMIEKDLASMSLSELSNLATSSGSNSNSDNVNVTSVSVPAVVVANLPRHNNFTNSVTQVANNKDTYISPNDTSLNDVIFTQSATVKNIIETKQPDGHFNGDILIIRGQKDYVLVGQNDELQDGFDSIQNVRALDSINLAQ
jgi:hypothetical protein